MGNVPNRMFLEWFKGLTKLTRENCCNGYQVTKENQIKNEYIALCFSENKNGISQIYPKL